MKCKRNESSVNKSNKSCPNLETRVEQSQNSWLIASSKVSISTSNKPLSSHREDEADLDT